MRRFEFPHVGKANATRGKALRNTLRLPSRHVEFIDETAHFYSEITYYLSFFTCAVGAPVL